MRRTILSLIFALIGLIAAFLLFQSRQSAPRLPSDTPSADAPPEQTPPAPKNVPGAELSAPNSTSASNNTPGNKAAESSKPENPEEAPSENSTPPTDKDDVVLGSLTKDEIDDGVRESFPEILACYQSALEAVPGLQGSITVKFTIKEEDGIGKVTKAKVRHADFDDVPMEDCLLDAMEDIQFAPPDSGIVIVSYPFNFEPG